MKLTSNNVRTVFIECLFKEDEITHLDKGEIPEYIVIAHGITINIGFHPYRLYKRYGDIYSMLMQLPKLFRKSYGLGNLFTEAYLDIYGNQWTDMHQIMEELFLLGIGSGCVTIPLPRSDWNKLPGSVPILVIKDY